VADYGTGEPLQEGQWQLQGGVDGVVETTTAELAALFSLGEADGYVTATGSGDPVEKAQVGEVVLTGGGANYTVESTPDSVVTLLNSTPAVADRLTASGSGTAVLQALPSTPLSGGVARASVVTAAALVALFQSVPLVAEAMMAEVTGDPAALVQPGQVYLSGGVEPASASTVNEVVGLLNGTPEVTALFQTTGSGETIVGAGSASLSGGGDQATLTGTRTYGWDVHGRLAQVSLPGGQVHSYSYDYRTRRIGLQQTASGTEPAKTTAVVFSGGLSLAEYESTTAQATIASPGQSTVRYVRGPDMGGGVGGLLYSRRAQAVKFNLSNGRGDIVAQSDTSGALTWTASYEAYGKRTKETGENLDKQRGNSKDEDPTGLLNEGFRYRDIETGVWLSRDPAGFVDGPNLYAYVKQNPWTSFDPDGLDTSYVDARTREIVNNVRKADPKLDQIVKEFEVSPYHFEFNATWSKKDTEKYGANGAFTPQTEDRKDALPRDTHDRYNGKGMGGRINAPKENVSDGKTPEQVMAHEMGHAFDANRGITPLDPSKPSPSKLFPTRSIDWDENENRAVRTENIYNEAKGIPVRKGYGGRDVPNPEAKNAPVNLVPVDAHPKKSASPTSSSRDSHDNNKRLEGR
jgi:RHS repeat-associated protein